MSCKSLSALADRGVIECPINTEASSSLSSNYMLNKQSRLAIFFNDVFLIICIIKTTAVAQIEINYRYYHLV